MRNALLAVNNINLIKDIVVKQLYKRTGIEIDKQDPFFKSNINNIVLAVVDAEVDPMDQPTGKGILRINTIIISEAVKFMISALPQQPQQPEEELQATSLDDLPDEEPEGLLGATDTIPVVVEHQPPPSLPPPQRQPLKPEFIDELITISSSDFSEINDEYFYNISITGMYITLSNLIFDKSDYIITEHTSSVMVNNEIISLPPGNYSPKNVVEYFNLLSHDIKLDYLTPNECFVIEYPKKISNTAKDLKEIRTINVDFCLKDSIHKKLGFDMKSYTIKQGESITGSKHRLVLPGIVKAILTAEDVSETYTVPLNVDYNNTVFFEDKYHKRINIKDKDVNKIKLKLVDFDGKPFNTRGRDFSVSLSINKLKDL